MICTEQRFTSPKELILILKGVTTMQNELKPYPFCGREVKIQGGPEEWHPTFYDPDSGGEPYQINCKCGCSFGWS